METIAVRRNRGGPQPDNRREPSAFSHQLVVLGASRLGPILRTALIGVERILDMGRSVVDVTGDVTAACYVASSEGKVLDAI